MYVVFFSDDNRFIGINRGAEFILFSENMYFLKIKKKLCILLMLCSWLMLNNIYFSPLNLIFLFTLNLSLFSSLNLIFLFPHTFLGAISTIGDISMGGPHITVSAPHSLPVTNLLPPEATYHPGW